MQSRSNVIEVPASAWASTTHTSLADIRQYKLRKAADACEQALAEYYDHEHILLRLTTAAHALDTSVDTVRHWIKTGKLPRVRIGRAVYVEREALQTFVEQHREG